MKIIYVNCGVNIAVIYATFAVTKECLKKIQARTGFESLTSPIPVQRSTN